jgi:hypothetical protein
VIVAGAGSARASVDDVRQVLSGDRLLAAVSREWGRRWPQQGKPYYGQTTAAPAGSGARPAVAVAVGAGTPATARRLTDVVGRNLVKITAAHARGERRLALVRRRLAGRLSPSRRTQLQEVERFLTVDVTALGPSEPLTAGRAAPVTQGRVDRTVNGLLPGKVAPPPSPAWAAVAGALVGICCWLLWFVLGPARRPYVARSAR